MHLELWQIFTSIGVVAITFLVANILAWIGEYYRQKRIIANVKKISSSGDCKNTPVTILTGSLGSGKTTALNHILKNSDNKFKIAVIINEIGRESIDHELISKELTEEIFVLKNGCICCVSQSARDLPRILDQLASLSDKNEINYVIVETTGLADPAPIVRTFLCSEFTSSRFTLDAVVTMVDCSTFFDQIKRVEICKQLGFADVYVLNKIDLIDEENRLKEIQNIKKYLININQGAKVLQADYGKFHKIDDVLNLKMFDEETLTKNLKVNWTEKGEHTHHVSSLCFNLKKIYLIKILDILEDLTKRRTIDIFRIKGLLHTDEGNKIIHGVHSNFFIENTNLKFEETKLVIIGKNLESENLKEKFEHVQVLESS